MYDSHTQHSTPVLDTHFEFESTAKQRSTFEASDLDDYELSPHVPRMMPDLELIQPQ